MTLAPKRFTGQHHEASLPGGAGLYDYGARWYDARVGRFITPDSLVPNPANPQDLNRYSYVRNNPLTNVDPSGHRTTKPNWWPPFLPYPFDTPDTWSRDDFLRWLSENNLPTAIAGQLGGDINSGFFVGGVASAELQWVFNFTDGDLTYVGNLSGAGRAGSVQNGVSAHVGFTLFTGASDTESVIVGASRFTSLDGTIAGVGASSSWSRAYNFSDTDGDQQFTLLGNDGHSEGVTTPVIDPLYKRTVDALALNAGVGINIPLPSVINGGLSHGITDTNRLRTFSVTQAARSLFVTPLQNAWNSIKGN